MNDMTVKMTESQIAHKANELFRQGKDDEAREMLKMIPIAPGVAWGIKRLDGVAGLQELIAEGYDMSEVEARFGKDWLSY
jgi:hypothetical protein